MMTFREFWPRYLQSHQHPRNRAAHYFATLISFGAIAAAFVLGQPWIAIAVIIASYCIAIAAHKIFEGNHSLVMVNPVWGAIADLKMCWLALTGRLAADLDLHAEQASPQHNGSSRQELGARLSGC